ncbi:MAG: hypothetical protein ACFB2X_08630 [Rivularia sp. (in: cyanobacteria)]
MFVSEKIVFIQLQKTGCTHIAKLLSNLLEGRHIGKHNRATPELFTNQRSFLGSIRDPWEWYVSLWAYGCDKKGRIYQRVTKRKGDLRGREWSNNPLDAAYSLLNDFSRNTDRWKRSYSDVNDASGFRDWLYMIHDKSYWNDFGEGYGSCPTTKFAGLLTYRYLKLFCRDNFNHILSFSDLKEFEKSNCYIDHFIRNENLEEDLVRALNLCGINISETQKNTIYYSSKTNTSSKKNKISYYYDNEMINLVNDRERFIIDKFVYTSPTA